MMRNAGKRFGVGALKTIARSGCRPVTTVRMQKALFKYKKPTVLDCADDLNDLSFCSADRNGLTRNSVRRSPEGWWSKGRGPTLALGGGG